MNSAVSEAVVKAITIVIFFFSLGDNRLVVSLQRFKKGRENEILDTKRPTSPLVPSVANLSALWSKAMVKYNMYFIMGPAVLAPRASSDEFIGPWSKAMVKHNMLFIIWVPLLSSSNTSSRNEISGPFGSGRRYISFP